MSRRFAVVGGGGGLLLLLGLVAITTRRRRIPRLRVIPEKIDQVDFTGTPAAKSVMCMEKQNEWNTLTREYIRLLQKWDVLQWVKENHPTKPLREYIDIPDLSILENLEQTNPEDVAHELRSMQQKLMGLRRILKEGCFREPNIPALEIPLFQDN